MGCVLSINKVSKDLPCKKADKMLSTGEENRRYDFKHPENADKWQGMFVNSLSKILEQVHPELTIDEPALEHAESLCIQLLAILCDAPTPLTLQDVEHRLPVLPAPIDKWAQGELREAQAQPRNQRRRYIMPVDKLHAMLQKEVMLYKIDLSVTLMFATILEYVTTDMLRLAGNFVKKISSTTISKTDLMTAMCADKVLMELFHPEPESGTGLIGMAATERRASLSYADLVRNLITDTKGFLRDVNLIIRVFKDEIFTILNHDTEAVNLIFGNIVDIYELTVSLLGNIEDAVEVSQDSPTPYIGSSFEDLLEIQEFYSYERYAKVVTSAESREALQRIVDDPLIWSRLETGGHKFGLAVKYYLPRLLLTPLTHVKVYHTYLEAMFVCTPHEDDKPIIRQVLSDLNKHIIKLTDIISKTSYAIQKEITTPVSSRIRRQFATEKLNELSKLVEKWDSREMFQYCTEFYREIKEIRVGSNLRQAFLFDGVLLLCKPTHSNNNTGPTHLKLKEKFIIRRQDIVDRPDTEECKNTIELSERGCITILLSFATANDKRNWMADLVTLNTKPMLSRTLDSILEDQERRHPLKFPPSDVYRFSEPDSPDNIVLEEKTGSIPIVKAGTLLKLIERLTYHVHADLAFLRAFLITYRTFCSPRLLLDLLIERFNIPDPSEIYDIGENGEIVPITDAEKLSKSSLREDHKRYRKAFQQPVKFRVINVLRHWVEGHFYDLVRDPELLRKMRDFLTTIDMKYMRRWAQTVLKIAERKSLAVGEDGSNPVFSFNESPPRTLRHVADVDKYNWHPLVLHPVELARQVTLLQFSIYRQVKPSEIVGSVWIKSNKEETSPNLLRAIRLTNDFTRWMQKCIVECENIEERVATLIRIIEMCIELRNLNNFNGVLAVLSFCASSSIHRLKATFQMLPLRLVRSLDSFKELNEDHNKRYHEQLKSINPPCVPFFGNYLTEIIHIEEGNKDYLGDTQLVNFTKCRMVANIISEIQQYQNQPYCLAVEKKTREFLENLDPFPGMSPKEIEDYLYEKSLEIEPRQPPKQTIKVPRKYPELSLKPIKDNRRHQTTYQIVDDNKTAVVPVSPTKSESAITVANDKPGKSDGAAGGVERCGSSASGQVTLGEKTKQKNRKRWSGREEAPPQRGKSKQDRATSSMSIQSWRPQSTSRRGPVVDNVSISSDEGHLNERIPPLLPRGPCYVDDPPPTPPRHVIVNTIAQVYLPPPPPPTSPMKEPPEPPERPPPSPMHCVQHQQQQEPIYMSMSALTTTQTGSPSSINITDKYMSAVGPAQTGSPCSITGYSDSEAGGSRSGGIASGGSAGPAFSFPSSPQPAGPSNCGTPPPLPPRRTKPPPLPPRSQAAQQLSCPTQGTIWQRRQHTVKSMGPKLPPKPVVGPRT